MRPALHSIAWLICTALAGAAFAQDRPNVLVIITDDQGYGDLSAHGNPHLKTPNIDRLAAQSVRFSQFIVSPVCTPTRASLMTGRYHFRTGAIDTYLGRALMHPDEVTLAETLGNAGYRTALFGKWHLGDNYPLRPQDQGFEEVLMHRGGGMVQPADPPGSTYFDPILQHNGRQEQRKGYCTDVFADAAMNYLDARAAARQQPFFVYLAFNAPHTPLQVDEAAVKPFRDKGLEETTARIYAMVQNIDHNVGRVLAKLDELKLADNTIVLYMHDNGPQQKRFNADLRGLKGSVYEGGIRSPLFIRYPARFKPATVGRLVTHIDVMPTLLDLCSIPVGTEGRFDGISFARLLADPAAQFPDRTLFIQWHRGDQPRARYNAAARNERWKLVNGEELYDLSKDPGESLNVADQHPDVVKNLRGAYDQWFADTTSDKRYIQPPIVLGSIENPSTLTRQDWRGPGATWNKEGLGHWRVRIAKPASYTFTARFPALASDATIELSIGEAKIQHRAAAGATSVTFERVALPANEAELHCTITADGKSVGPHYIDVQRVD